MKDQAHRIDWGRPARRERAQFLIAVVGEALVLGLFFFLFLFGLSFVAALMD